MLPFVKESQTFLWLNKDVLTPAEIKSYRDSGLDITAFAYPIDPKNQAQISEAFYTISEHHPEERIWVEQQSET